MSAYSTASGSVLTLQVAWLTTASLLVGLEKASSSRTVTMCPLLLACAMLAASSLFKVLNRIMPGGQSVYRLVCIGQHAPITTSSPNSDSCLASLHLAANSRALISTGRYTIGCCAAELATRIGWLIGLVGSESVPFDMSLNNPRTTFRALSHSRSTRSCWNCVSTGRSIFSSLH